MSLFQELKRRNVIRVAIFYVVSAWLVLQIADLIFELLLVPDWTLRFIFGLLLAAFPFVLFFAWAYEVTPEGVKREVDVDRSASVTGQTGRKLDRVIIGLLVVLIGVVGIDQMRSVSDDPPATADALEPPPPPPTAEMGSGTFSPPENVPDPISLSPSIAVLAFRDMSAAGDQDYFAEGIAEELLNALVRIEGLRVASRTSSFSFKDQNVDLPTIAEQLQVSHILEGSVRTAGNRVRITAQLIQVAGDQHLWSETYDRTLDDIFAIQDEITAKVVGELETRLVADAAPSTASNMGTDDPQAYRLYLRGRHEWRQRNADSLQRAIDLFREAIELDPDFARAWSNLAVALENSAQYDNTVDKDASAAEALAAAERALELQPGMAEALIIKANSLDQACRMTESRPILEAALAAGPDDPTVNHWFAMHLAGAGYTSAALEMIQRAYALDPLNAAIVSQVGLMTSRTGDFEEALAWMLNGRELGILDGDPLLHAIVLATNGEVDEAADLLRITRMTPNSAWVDDFVRAIREPGPQPELEAAVMAQLQEGVAQVFTGWFLSAMQSDLLADTIQQGQARCDGGYLEEIWHPMNLELRRSERIFDALESIGLVDYWRRYGWPDLCEDLPQDRAECPQ